MEAVVAGAAGVVVLVQVIGTWLIVRERRALRRVEERVSRLADAMSLLTDTTECGLRDVALEIGRLSAVAPAAGRTRAATQRRVAGAARRGRSVQDIAAAEQMSEGEVRLRLQLANPPSQAHDAPLR